MKRDYILLAFAVVIMVVTSSLVPDSRLTDGLKSETIMQGVVKEIASATDKAEAMAMEQGKSEEEPEEVMLEEIQEEQAEEFSEEYAEEELEDYTEPLTYIGTFEITAYEYTGSPCANGNYPTPYVTVACNSLDFGTKVYIDGVGYCIVEDRGAEWHGSDWMDLYIGDIEACYEWGIQYRDVYIVG